LPSAANIAERRGALKPSGISNRQEYPNQIFDAQNGSSALFGEIGAARRVPHNGFGDAGNDSEH
jgi:hypothetical protein